MSYFAVLITALAVQHAACAPIQDIQKRSPSSGLSIGSISGPLGTANGPSVTLSDADIDALVAGLGLSKRAIEIERSQPLSELAPNVEALLNALGLGSVVNLPATADKRSLRGSDVLAARDLGVSVGQSCTTGKLGTTCTPAVSGPSVDGEGLVGTIVTDTGNTIAVVADGITEINDSTGPSKRATETEKRAPVPDLSPKVEAFLASLETYTADTIDNAKAKLDDLPASPAKRTLSGTGLDEILKSVGLNGLLPDSTDGTGAEASAEDKKRDVATEKRGSTKDAVDDLIAAAEAGDKFVQYVLGILGIPIAAPA